MKKKKVFFYCILTVIVLIVVLKLYTLIFWYNVLNNLEHFKNENNRYYSVEIIDSGIQTNSRIIYKKDDIIKYVSVKPRIGEYCEMKNLLTKEEIVYNVSNKIKYEKQQELSLQDNLLNIPNIINIDNINDVSIKFNKIFKIRYIIPITYEGKKCYKIVTNFEIVIIDKSTYLPVYSTTKIANSKSKDNKIEYKYKFEVGTVTDEDMALPDFSDYKIE